MTEPMSDERVFKIEDGLAHVGSWFALDAADTAALLARLRQAEAEIERLLSTQEKVKEFAEEMMQSEVHKFMGMDLRDLIGGSDG